jgi:peroxiredoxin
MKRLSLILLSSLTFAVVAPLALFAGERGEDAPVREGPRTLDPRGLGIGRLLPDVAFTDLDGKEGRLSDLRGKTVLVFARSVTCPVGKKYGPTMKRIAAAWAERDVEAIVLGVAEHDSADDLRADRERTGIDARWVQDSGGAFAAVLGVRSTTEVFVIDGARTLVYRGAIDDRIGLGYAREEARRHYLTDALTAVAARERPDGEATTAPGCVIDPKERAADDEAPTYHGRIARILERSCVDCHRPGEAAPFALQTFAQAKGNRSMIRLMVERRLMPPWFAGPETGVAMGNDRSLSDADREAVLAWIAAGCPEGEAADAPLPLQRAEGWKIGVPDVVIEPPEAFTVPAEGVVEYQYVTVGTDFDADRWVQAFEIRPSAPEVVHHVLVFAQFPASHERMMEQPRQRNGLEGYFAAMVPGQNHLVFPEDSGRFLPKGTRLRFQIHYTPNGEEVQDRPRLGLVLTKERPRHEVLSQGVYETHFRIPPGKKDFPVSATHTLAKPGRLLSLTPHMHVRGSAFRYELILPDGTETVLLDVPRYDFNWQLNYRFREPIDVPAGAVVRATGTFDNSADNPANPDPAARVHFGEQTFDEMMIGYVEWIPLGD